VQRAAHPGKCAITQLLPLTPLQAIHRCSGQHWCPPHPLGLCSTLSTTGMYSLWTKTPGAGCGCSGRGLILGGHEFGIVEGGGCGGLARSEYEQGNADRDTDPIDCVAKTTKVRTCERLLGETLMIVDEVEESIVADSN
jgi:hypothetical protein